MTDNISRLENGDVSNDRQEIMTQLAARIEFIDDRVATLLTEEEPDEQLLIRWIRTQGYLAGQYRKLMKDIDIDEIQDELDLLKEIMEVEDA